ncbi:T9SS type A sorting domain-containing protein, partial [candidate division WOR-3 bacterium]|nr:T9SS type A sorting domain-containing protein [candidate division WOR-3 bacterium]
SQPLSDANTTQIPWFDWDATEVAPRLVSIAGEIWAYGIWVHNVQGALYFERGLVKPFSPVAVSEDTKESILHARLHVTPSITRSQTRIDFTLPDPAWVEIDLYDIRGRLVSSICQGHCSGGHHSIDLNRNDLPNGIYFVSLQTHSDVFMQKFVLMR